MPDFSSSLPQIIPEKPQAQPAPQPSPFSPAVNSDLSTQESASLAGDAKSPRRFPLSVKKFVAGLILLVVIVVSWIIYFVVIPGTQAKSYVEQTFADFEKIHEAMVSGKGQPDDETANSSLEIAKGVHFDVSQTLVYVYSSELLDTKEDLESIKTMQLATADARRSSEKYRVGGSVKELDRLLDEYFDKLDDGLNRIYLFENFKIEVFEAIGEEQAKELDKLLGVYGESTSREEKIRYVENLATLTQQSVSRLRALGAVPDDLRVFHEQIVASYDDMAAVLEAMRKEYEAGSAEGDAAALAKLSDLGQRHLERSRKVQEENGRVVQESQTRQVFGEVISLEEKIKAEFDRLRKDFGLTDGE